MRPEIPRNKIYLRYDVPDISRGRRDIFVGVTHAEEEKEENRSRTPRESVALFLDAEHAFSPAAQIDAVRPGFRQGGSPS